MIPTRSVCWKVGAEAVAELDAGAGAVGHGENPRARCRTLVAMDELDQLLRAHRLGGVTERALPRWIDTCEAAAPLDRREQVERGVVTAQDFRFQSAALIDEDTEKRAERQACERKREHDHFRLMRAEELQHAARREEWTNV
jgi:hypothetical protein